MVNCIKNISIQGKNIDIYLTQRAVDTIFEKIYAYSKRQIYLPFTISLRGIRTIFARKILRLHAAKIGAGNVIRKNL